MKKKLFLALLTTLLLLLAATTALAISPSDFNCSECGEPCTEWFPTRSIDGTALCHAPFCRACWAVVSDATTPCTPVEGTATCIEADLCSVCGYPDTVNGAPDPNAHDISRWLYNSSTRHYRYCQNCYAEDTYEYEDHYGGTATCTEKAICEVCGNSYGEFSTKHVMSEWKWGYATQHMKYCTLCCVPESFIYEDHYGGTATCIAPAICEGCGNAYGDVDPNNHDWDAWIGYDGGQHLRTCKDPTCGATEYAEHTGGDGSCFPICEVCGWNYLDNDGNHGEMSEWLYTNGTQHYRYCLVCGFGYEFADHSGGTATCMMPTICEDCHDFYGDRDVDNHSVMGSWTPYDETRHSRRCADCGSNASREYEEHYGGTATCSTKAICEGCGMSYGTTTGVHLNMSPFAPYNATQHARYCTDCELNESYEYEDHYGGTATCSDLASCEVCGKIYGGYDPTRHTVYSRWEPESNTQHSRYCVGCNSPNSTEYEDHYSSETDCERVCEGCGVTYYVMDGEHTMGGWGYHSADQHYRICNVCWDPESVEYADHYGGTPGCSMGAICEGCNFDYGPLDPDTHLNMSQWEPYADGHQRHCADCRNPDTFERAPHTGDGSCKPACIDCHEIFNDPDGEHDITSWIPTGDGQHVRYCQICRLDETYEYADHVGDGACTSDCQDCGNSFYNPEGKHSLTDWSPYSDDQHFRYCQLCGLEETFEFGDHITSVNPGTLPCYKTVTCGDCGFIMGFGTQHLLSEWLPYSPLQHMRYCTTGGTAHVEEYDLHSGGDGSCMSVCEGCGCLYSPLNGAHQWGEWTPNGDGTHTRVCALNEEHTETADCTFSDWALADDQYHIRACTDCGDEETGEHTGGTATCSSPRICDVCSEGYGSPDNSGLTGHPNPTIEEKPGTCYDEGYYRVTCDEPGCSMPFFEIATPANGQHLYNHWDILGGNRHHTDCAQCGENAEVACTLWQLQEGDAMLTVCPVCGDFVETPFAILIARDDTAVPIGTLLVRGLAEPIDGALFGFTVAGVYGGEVVDIHGVVTVTLPVECEAFTVVRVDITDGAEVRTEIPFSLENGQLTIKTDAAGLFLLIPAE